MRRRTIFLAAGLSAYSIGASVRAYLRRHEGTPCGDCVGLVSRAAVVRHPRAAFHHPLLATEYLVAPVCND